MRAWVGGFFNVWVFGNMCTGICCVLFCFVCTAFFVLFRLSIFILICFVRNNVRTTATE